MATNKNGDNQPPPERGNLPVPDLRTMEELCQPTLNGRGGPIAPIAIKAMNFGLKNDMIQQVQNSCQFHRLLDKPTSKSSTPSCDTCGGPHSYNDCPATVGQTQNVYAAGAYNQVFNDAATTNQEEENWRNNKEEKHTSSRHAQALVVTRRRSAEHDPSGSHGKFKSGRKKGYKCFKYGGSVYSCNDHELKIIEIRGIMVKMHDGMNILVERKLLHGLIKVSLPFCEHCVISEKHRLKFKTSSVFVLELVHSDVWHAPVLSLGGENCFVSFIDDYSRRCWVYPIKKSDVFKVFKVYKSNDTSEAIPQHEENETTESQAPTTRTLNHERKRPTWHLDYVMESNVAYCLLTKEGKPSTLQEALNNQDASSWKEAMQEEIKALHKNKTWN
nr:Gag-Pol polyprotein [Tanacetum cinerariifolium]